MGVLLLLMLAGPAISASNESVWWVGRFSPLPASGLPPEWKPLSFPKIPNHTQYELVQDEATTVVKASSEASASGLTRAVTIDPREYPIVRWRWKVDRLLERSDVRRKSGDDYPARLYITFEYEPARVSFARKLKYMAGRALFGDIPIAAINYIWDRATPAGTIVPNAYTDFAQMVVVQSGPANVGRWIEEERNVYEDYLRAFGEEPPHIKGIAIMTDTDDTRDRATAFYGDIAFVKP
jgi:hypothetical protein